MKPRIAGAKFSGDSDANVGTAPLEHRNRNHVSSSCCRYKHTPCRAEPSATKTRRLCSATQGFLSGVERDELMAARSSLFDSNDYITF